MLRILTIRDDAQRASEIGNLHQEGVLREFAELLIDCEEDRFYGPYLWACSGKPADLRGATQQHPPNGR
jgi:hypothetical protein